MFQHKFSSLLTNLFALVLVLAPAVQAQAQAYGQRGYDPRQTELRSNELPDELRNVGITSKVGETLDADLELINEDGEPVILKSFMAGEKPMILSLVYFSCPTLCNIHLNGLFETLHEITLRPGKDYQMVAVSFDPHDTPEIAKQKKENYLKQYGLEEHADGVHFLTGTSESIRRLTESVGFSYKWDEEQKQWNHASAAIFLTPGSLISRYLHGIVFEPKTTKLSLIEASEGKVGSLIDQVMLYCFNYDPKENKYAFAAFNAMRLGAGLIVVILTLILVPFWLKSRRARPSH